MQATCRTQNSKQFCVKPAEPQLSDNALQSMYSQHTVSVQSCVQSEWSEAVFPHAADGMCCGAPACFTEAGLSAFPEPARLSASGH